MANLIKCPYCHNSIDLHPGKPQGRKSMDMPVKKVIDALSVHSSVKAAADSLGISRGYIYHVFKSLGINPKTSLKKEVKENG